MFSFGIPTDSSPAMISRTISGEEQQAGAPEGLILTPTTSLGSTNLAQAARNEPSPVNSFNPRSIMPATTACDTRLPTMALAADTCTTRPGYNPGIPSGEACAGGRPRTLTAGGSGKETWA